MNLLPKAGFPDIRANTLSDFIDAVAASHDIGSNAVKCDILLRLIRDYSSDDPLYFRVLRDTVEGVARMLIYKYTALTMVCDRAWRHKTTDSLFQCIDILISAGVCINWRDGHGATPLEYILVGSPRHFDMIATVRGFLSRGANVTMPLRIFRRIRITERYNYKDMILLLEEYGFNLDLSTIYSEDHEHVRNICREMPLTDCRWFLDKLISWKLDYRREQCLLALAFYERKISIDLLKYLIDIGVPVLRRNDMYSFGHDNITPEKIAAMRIILDAASNEL